MAIEAIADVESIKEGTWVAFLEGGKPGIGLTVRKQGRSSFIVEVGSEYARRAKPDGAVYLLGQYEIDVDHNKFRPDQHDDVPGTLLLMKGSSYMVFSVIEEKVGCVDLSSFEPIEIPMSRADFVATRWSVVRNHPVKTTLLSVDAPAT